MTHVFYRAPNVTMPLAVGGEGIYVIDDSGRRYLDSCSGVAVSSLGYNHPGAIAALQQQASTLAYAYGGVFRNQAAEDLADFLIARSPNMSHAYFLSSGSEIMEIALKTAFQYFVELGKPQRRLVISRRQNYHGSTLGVLTVSGNVQRRDIFDPVLAAPHYVSPCYAYRNQAANETEADYVQRLANELEAKILELGADNVAAFVAETVVGSTSGAVPPVKGYFQAMRKVCDQYGVLLILDEVMCGMGRTGHLFACAEDEVVPDILTIGKGLAAGYQPISAMLVGAHIHEAIASGSGMLRNGQTFAFHATACATALAVQHIIEEENLLANVQRRGEQLRGLLRETFAEHPNVGDVRGRGLFVGVELVADRLSKQPLPPSQNLAARIRPLAMEAGMMSYPLGGTIDGKHGDHVLFAPPFIVSESEIEQIVAIFAKVLNKALG
ncbi:aspartate aminotransferase family protein [Pseudomonas sp. NA-150]|uniref:aspartate aminotransferase family protein n=1 Tax=Pseudomonas sp. NA-150 TaxID=3367525 RepID=UPI0037CC1815